MIKTQSWPGSAELAVKTSNTACLWVYHSVGMWMLIAAEPVYLICTKRHALLSLGERQIAENLPRAWAWVHCVNTGIIWGLFALVWLMYVFVFKYRRWKGSSDNRNGTEIDSWLDHMEFMWLIVLIRLCRGERGLLFELLYCRGDPNGRLNCHIYCARHASFYAVSQWMKNKSFFPAYFIMSQVWVRGFALLQSQKDFHFCHGL